MFTGLVEEVGTVVAVATRTEGRRMTIRAPGIATDLAEGASVAVDGACLTVAALKPDDALVVDVVPATLARTVAGGYRAGARVNLERALRMGDRLGGHLVQGHVDGVGSLVSRTDPSALDGARLLTFRVPAEVARATILHGSITINGVSLTVSELPGPELVRVAIVPFTWEHTNLAGLAPGAPVNVEGDLIGKYVGTLLSVRTPDPGQG